MDGNSKSTGRRDDFHFHHWISESACGLERALGRSPAAPEYRKRFEDYTVRIYELFSDAIHEQFPALSKEECHEKALFL